MNRRYLFGIILVAVATVVFSVFCGMKCISPGVVFSRDVADALDRTILLRLRIPRTFTGLSVGAALAISGMVFQALFRNPLATPYTLGVSTGASLGAVAAISLGFTGCLFLVPITVPFALIGAFAVIVGVYLLSGKGPGFTDNTLLLAGVAINLFCASFILFLQFMSNQHESYQVVRWLMGSLVLSDYVSTVVTGLVAVTSIMLVFRNRYELDLLLTGDDLAMTRGVEIARVRTQLYFVLSLTIAVAVAFCGPIGFIGIMVPHVCRKLFSHRHGILVFPVALCGGGLLVFCDTLARIIRAPAELPVGIIMAMLGGPFFLVILLKTKRRG